MRIGVFINLDASVRKERRKSIGGPAAYIRSNSLIFRLLFALERYLWQGVTPSLSRAIYIETLDRACGDFIVRCRGLNNRENRRVKSGFLAFLNVFLDRSRERNHNRLILGEFRRLEIQ